MREINFNYGLLVPLAAGTVTRDVVCSVTSLVAGTGTPYLATAARTPRTERCLISALLSSGRKVFTVFYCGL